jgi:uncharacterized membrane protein
VAKVTNVVGFILIVVGLVSYFATDRASTTALLPAALGVVFLVLGLVAGRSEGSRRHAMHAAMLVALLGVAGSFTRIGGLYDGEPAAVASAITGIVCLVFLVLGIRSFMEARKAR